MKKDHTVDLSCSFCGKSQREVRKLIAGPTVYICDECIKRCNEIIAEEEKRAEAAPEPKPAPSQGEWSAKTHQTLCCSFCGKSQREVRKLIAGPTVYICDECIGLCNDIIAEEIEREECAFLLRGKLFEGELALIVGILERGMPAAIRIRNVLDERIIEEILRRGAASEAPDRRLWVASRLAADWADLQDILTRASAQPGESGEEGRLRAQPPEWLNPIAERLAGTVEVLDVLARTVEKPGFEEMRHLGPSIDIAVEKLREAREMLLARPSRSPEESS